ncbi:MAG: sigma-70 family RNA polymerase sigma factor [Firmicutes bacterium]|nr:sigma-70 family RNA polymerase sigma factor [Bacillota bacterium]
MNDAEILKLFLERSERAIEVLSEKYGRAASKLTKNIVGDERDAEECVNDAYLAVWNTVPPKEPSPMSQYLYGIVRNISVNRVRYNTAEKRGEYTLCLDELEEAVPSPDGTESEFESGELSHAIDAFIDTLGKTDRMIFVRRYWYLDSISDLSKAAGLREGAVRTRLSRIRSRLKKFLERKGEAL